MSTWVSNFKSKFVGTAILSISAMLFVGVPLWMVLVNSFKSQSEAASLRLGLPEKWELVSNYKDVLVQSDYLRSLTNSLFVTGVSVGILLLVGAPAAWAFARSNSNWLKIFYWISLIGVLLPLPIVPMVYLIQRTGLRGTLFGLVLYTIGSKISIVVFLMTGFARGLPRELDEAAALDGAAKWRIFTSIVAPMMKPVFAATFVILAVLIWNDFYGPLFLISDPDQATLPLGLYRLSSGQAQATAWNYVFAHVTLVSLPLIALYLVAQKKIVEGVTTGAIRG